MVRLKTGTWFAMFLGALVVCASGAYATDIGGTISGTVTITEDSQLVDDVNCTVTGAPCIAIGAPNVTLDLNGFTMTGQADPQTGCGGTSIANEVGIDVNAQTNAVIIGPGLVKQFRNMGIRLLNSTGSTVRGVTMSTNCSSGIIVQGGSLNVVEGNTSTRNGNMGAPCGGIWIASGTSRNRIRGNRLIGNGYVAQGSNFGIGDVSSANRNNVIEDNIVVGNANGIILVSGVQGDVVRRNFVVGNPPVQVSLDHTPGGGVDILNLADDGANTFRGNICLTSVNAPCPAVGRASTSP